MSSKCCKTLKRGKGICFRVPAKKSEDEATGNREEDLEGHKLLRCEGGHGTANF